MSKLEAEKIRNVKSFEQLVELLKKELDWPLDGDDIEDLSFEYDPEEIGLSEEAAVKINYIKQLRPFAYNQPWGIFYIDFEPKKLPVVVLKRVLQKLTIKRRQSANQSEQKLWEKNDLLFINSFGEQHDRAITFAHFREESENKKSFLRVIGWDGEDTPLHLDRCMNELQNLRYSPDLSPEDWRQQWSSAFSITHQQVIKTSKNLAKRLAELAKDIRQHAEHILRYETEKGRFKKALAKFKTALIHDLSEEDFADMYAQTIAYGLLYTAIRSHVSGEQNQVSAERVKQLVLPTNPFLKEVMEEFFNIGSRNWDSDAEKIVGIEFDELGINQIIETLKDDKTDFDAILRDFGNKNPNEDPVIHFYELFLKEYDALKRKSRGVYYTPQPVVSFIVRSVHEVLKKDFGLELGLADTSTWGEMIKKNADIKLPKDVNEGDFFVQILDPATGTGTFLVETIDLIHKTMVEKWEKDGKSESEVEKQWNQYVPEKLLPRLYGFELMMAPYAIAHMKIGIKLYETGYRFGNHTQRVKVYLTNTLEEPVDTSGYLDTLDPAIATESKQANEIKELNSITVVIGNPPYAVNSFNNGQWIYNLLRKKLIDNSDSYFSVDGKDLNERNPKNLNDDYVKFIRYAQYRLAGSKIGVFGFITNHGYIDNLTFRGMRQSLMNTYNKINIIDLHGNAKKKEKSPDGSKDENVFEIQQGVAINIAAILSAKNKEYNHNDLWGTKEAKNAQCKNKTLSSLENRIKLKPVSEMYLFCPQDQDVRKEYNKYQKITNIIPENTNGFKTHRDNFAIDIEHQKIHKRISEMRSNKLPDDDYRIKYSLKDSGSWKLSEARKSLRADKKWKDKLKKCLYRPFDIQHCYFSNIIMDRPRRQLISHIASKTNVCILTTRQLSHIGWRHVLITNLLPETCSISLQTKECTYAFPLYLYPEEGSLDFSAGPWEKGINGRTPNLDPKFVEQLASGIGVEFISDGKGDLQNTFGPEDIFNYIYSVFHSPTYRKRYAEFLKIDFPRVPTTSDKGLFKGLCGLGDGLVKLHLMESERLNSHITTFPIEGENAVTKVGETKKKLKDVKDGKGKLYINSTQYFDGLPEEVWNFHIGGYQVCYKWLADRKKAGRSLSAEDIEHYHRIVVALNETIKTMKQIDEVIDSHGSWPIK